MLFICFSFNDRIFSYFICHSPLFWTLMERNQFANAYDFIRKQFRHDFDNVIKLNYDIYRVDDWELKIPTPISHPLRAIFDFRLIGKSPPNYMLMQYIRYCYHHYSDKVICILYWYSKNILDIPCFI